MVIVDQLGVVVKYLYDEKTAKAAKNDFAELRRLSVATFAAVAGASAVGLARMSVQVSNQVTNWQRLGESLGMTTQGYLEMSHAFQVVGADMNDISDALQTISDYGLEAASGNKEWIRTFTAAGVSIKDLKQAKPEDILRVTADGIASLKTEAEQAAASSRLFGDDLGRKLLPLIKHGYKAFQDLRDEQRMFGGIVTEAQADRAAELTISLRQLDTIIPSLQRRIGLGLAPVLQHVADKTHAWARETMPLINGQIDRQMGILQRAIENIDTPLERLVVLAGGAAVALGTFGMVRSLYQTASAASPAIAAVGALANRYGTAALGAGKLGAALFLLYGAYDDIKVTAEGGDAIWSRLGKAMGAEGETQAAAKSLMEMFNNLLDLSGQLAYSVGTGLVDAFNDLADAMGFELPEWMQTLSGMYKGAVGFLGDRAADIGTAAGVTNRYLTNSLTDVDIAFLDSLRKREEQRGAAFMAEEAVWARNLAHPGDLFSLAIGETDPHWNKKYSEETDAIRARVTHYLTKPDPRGHTTNRSAYSEYEYADMLAQRSVLGSDAWLRGAGTSPVNIGDISVNLPPQSYPTNEEIAAGAAREIERQILDALNQSAP